MCGRSFRQENGRQGACLDHTAPTRPGQGGGPKFAAGARFSRKSLLNSRRKCGLLKAFGGAGRAAWPTLATRRPIVKRFLFLALAAGLLGCTSAQAANPIVVMDTSMGTIKIELFEDKAPVTVKNFLGYVEDKFYDGTVFHRVIPNFMVQGGGFEPGLKQKKTKEAIKNEAANGLSNNKYTIAMARTNDPDSATAQFFINVKDNKFLDKSADSDGYAVFGKVIEGQDVVDKIKDVETGSKGGFKDVPVQDVVIKSIRRADK
jgi:peptidyl-prolyl cis-trans isomerase B (cyclophilin B)